MKPTTVDTNTIAIKTIRETLVFALIDAIDEAPIAKQVALFDALDAWKRSRNVDYVLKNQPVARMLLDAIEEGMVDVAIARDCSRDDAKFKHECAEARRREILDATAAICRK